jgi:predicted MFS family arabinose efflux permease
VTTSDTRTSAWRPVLAYAAVSAANQMLWLTYAPITTGAAHHYGVSTASIGWLAEIFPLVYVVLAVPTGRLLDRGLVRWLSVGAVLTGLGAVVRVVAADFWVALGGQVLVAVAQPFVLNAVLAVSAGYLLDRDRTRGISVSSAGVFAGMVLALVLGAGFGAGQLRALLAVQAVLAVAAAVVLILALRTPPRAQPRTAPPALRAVWNDGYIRLLLGLICAGFGVFVALTTWLQALLEPAGVSESAAGVMLLVMVLAGVAGAALLPPWLARRGWEIGFITVSVAAGVAGLVVLAAAPGVVSGVLVLLVVGALLLTDLPVVLELAERRAGDAAGTAGALVWLAGNAAGLVAALVVQALLDHPAAAFLVLAALLAAGFPLAHAVRQRSSTGQPSPGE